MAFDWTAASAATNAQERYALDQSVLAQRKQQMDAQAFALEQARANAAQQQQTQQFAGNALANMMPPVQQQQQQQPQPPQSPQLPAGPSPSTLQAFGMPPPQPPEPGQPSVPMTPPVSAVPTAVPTMPPQGQTQPSGNSGPPQIPPYISRDQALQGIPRQQAPYSQGMAPPPVPPTGQDVAAKVFSPQAVLAQLKAQGVPQQLWLPTLEQMKPIFDMQGQEQLRQLKVQHEASQAAIEVYKAIISGQSLEERTRHDKAMESAAQQRINKKGAGAGGGAGGFSGKEFTVEDAYKVAAKFGISNAGFDSDVRNYRTNQTLPTAGRSQKALPYINAIKTVATSQSPDENVSVNKAEFDANKKAYSFLTTREAAVEQITGALTAVNDKIIPLTQKVNTAFGGEFGNKTLNDLYGKFGDNADIQTLKVLAKTYGREYIKAVTAAGSNAQMHAAHKEDAEELINGNMPLNKMKGAIEGVSIDIKAFQKSIADEKKVLSDRMHPPAAQSKPSSGASDWSAADEARLKELEAKHGAK